MSEVTRNSHSNHSRYSRRPLWGIMLLVGVIALASGWAMGSRLGFRGRAHRFQAASVEELRGDLEQITRWSLLRVDASDGQKQQIQAIVAGLAPEIFELQTERERLRGRLDNLLRAGDVDAQELEAVRAESIRLADRASARMVAALTQALAVLTPAQRQEMLEQWGSRRWRE